MTVIGVETARDETEEMEGVLLCEVEEVGTTIELFVGTEGFDSGFALVLVLVCMTPPCDQANYSTSVMNV